MQDATHGGDSRLNAVINRKSYSGAREKFPKVRLDSLPSIAFQRRVSTATAGRRRDGGETVTKDSKTSILHPPEDAINGYLKIV